MLLLEYNVMTRDIFKKGSHPDTFFLSKNVLFDKGSS